MGGFCLTPISPGKVRTGTEIREVCVGLGSGWWWWWWGGGGYGLGEVGWRVAEALSARALTPSKKDPSSWKFDSLFMT